MFPKQYIGWCLVVLISTSSLVSTLTYPSQVYGSHHMAVNSEPWKPTVGMQIPRQQEGPVYRGERKFAEKPNALKKVALDDIDADIQTNQIGQESGFSWSNMIGMIMQMLFNGGGIQGPNKSDGLDNETGLAPSPWANLLSVGLKIISAVLGVTAGTDNNIDKVDNGGSSPMQGILAAVLSAVLGTRDPDQVATMAKQAGEFINIVVNLLDALKTSFSHRSIAARNLGRKDTMSDAAVASITLLKGYMKTLSTSDDQCMQMYVCEANRECAHDIGSSMFCQFGTYAASYILERSSNSTFDNYFEAGRRGRSGNNCRQSYHECNEV
ncbi:uncharacterized protein LOC123292396 isoform X1 [Chrysoperla carnea]|uniref:uncharacterized protein LOC123292396 isoform X1 n=1 Tax=Chrysoperla carnea TaxID=189513 RepID=UPI001D073E1D|nr:uncharacterized protein LOC123292396 isoform X1 [Chrysoperla carnea]